MTMPRLRSILVVVALVMAVSPLAASATEGLDGLSGAPVPAAPAPPTTLALPPPATTLAPPTPVPTEPPTTVAPSTDVPVAEDVVATIPPTTDLLNQGDVGPTGFLTIAKTETGGHRPSVPGTYTIAYDGPAGADGQVQVTAGTPVVVGPLPVGQYSLTEVAPPADATVTITPDPVTVSEGDEATAVEVTVRNHYPGEGNHGFLRIEKVETGDDAPTAPGTYAIAYDGPGDADGQVQVTAGTPEVVGPLPLGDYLLGEVDPPEGASVTISPNPVSLTTPGRMHAVLVTVTNHFEAPVGFLEIEKVELGEGAPSLPGTYTITYEGPVDGQVEVTAGTPVVVGPLPLGDYTLAEVDPPQGAAATIAPNPVAVVEGDEASAVLVTVTNRWPAVGPGGVDDGIDDALVDDGVDTTTGVDGSTTGTLPRTGREPMPLLVTGLSLAAVGALLLVARRALDRPTG